MDITLLLHKENLEQRQKWQLISFVMISVILIETLFLCFLSHKVAQKKEVVRYVEFSEKGDFGFKILPSLDINLSQRKLLIEQQLQQYVLNRVANVATKESGESEVDNNNIKFVFAFSSKKISEQYESELLKIYNEAKFIKRDVQILSFSEIEERKYRFDFKTIDVLADGRRNEKRWVVYLRYDLVDPNSFKIEAHKEINPLGVKITYYRGDIDRKQKIEVQNVQ